MISISNNHKQNSKISLHKISFTFSINQKLYIYQLCILRTSMDSRSTDIKLPSLFLPFIVLVVMDQSLENSFSANNETVKARTMRVTKHGQCERTNRCNQCKYASYRADDLRTHLKTHSEEKSNKCNQCNYASSQAGYLRKHLKTHSEEKSSKCNQCDYASSNARYLRKHMIMHSGEKANKCNQCDYEFSLAASLKAHLKIHIGEN